MNEHTNTYGETLERLIERRERYCREQPQFFRTIIAMIEQDIEKTSDPKVKRQLVKRLKEFQGLLAKLENDIPRMLEETERVRKELDSLR